LELEQRQVIGQLNPVGETEQLLGQVFHMKVAALLSGGLLADKRLHALSPKLMAGRVENFQGPVRE
jgi:hypothetical protein